MMPFLRTVVARAYPRVLGPTRNPTELIFQILFPLLGTFAMVFVYRGLHAPPRFIGFVVLGGAMLAFWQNVLWFMAIQWNWDRGNGTLELFVISPASLTAVLLGMALGGMYMTGFRAGAVLLLGSLAFGVTYNAAALAPAIGVFVLTLGALYCLGMMLASLFLFYGREAWHLGNALQEPVYFLSGFYFPVRALGAYVAGAASLLPLTLGLDAIRQLLIGGSFTLISPAVEGLLLAIQVVLYAIGAQLALRYMEMRARRDARLIARQA
jgi:ABC-2 type transport system permease protein